MLDVCRALFQERLDTLVAVGKRKTAVIQRTLNIQPLLQCRRFGLLASDRQIPE
jgi:hypothetical protein